MKKNLGFYDRTLRGGLGVMLATFGITSGASTGVYIAVAGALLLYSSLAGWSLAYQLTQLNTNPDNA